MQEWLWNIIVYNHSKHNHKYHNIKHSILKEQIIVMEVINMSNNCNDVWILNKIETGKNYQFKK